MSVNADNKRLAPHSIASPFVINEEEIEMKQMSRDWLARLSEPSSDTVPETVLDISKSRDRSRSRYSNFCLKDILIGCIGELFGTCLMTFLICTLLASSVITGSQMGVWQVALPSGLAVSIAIYLSAHISDGHVNPALTLAFTIVRWKQFRVYRAVPHMISQIFGAFLAASLVYLFYYEAIEEYERVHNITRGEDGSQITATIFVRYFPNPVVYDPTDSSTFHLVPIWKALLIESFATFILVFVIFGLSHPTNSTTVKHWVFVPALIGITVAILISIFGPLTQAGMNPAFDLGPRLFAFAVGWGKIALPGPRNGFWVYTIGPLVGGPLGGLASDLIQFIVRKCKNKN